ncbi:hypothetical protein BpHYR1_013339 [Brachionus plicatilis]|uniref:Uncharacterized protein n=1 Tax=Brachionus plicatilis TaxID=10195 RepID=A0A3M7QDF4_BRAPC|nr:hypothetical protein BpHYR1_013339 [Brachionus plicatilis]
MICDHCSCNQEDLFLFSLPCGYLVCHEHIISQDNSFECFSILNLCDHVDSIKQDIGSYLKDCLSSVNSKIDLKRETLKAHFNKIIDDHYESLRSQVEEHESKYTDTIKQDLNQIDTKKIRDEIQNQNQIEPTDFNALNKFLTDLKTKNLDQNLQQMEQFQNFDFYQSEKEPDLDISELFGSFSQNDTQMVDEKSKSSDQPKFICKVGLAKFEELSNGQIVSKSFSKPSNLVIYDPQSGRIKEIAGKSSIKFLFTKEDTDEIIVVDDEFNVRIFLDGKCLNSYNLIKKGIRRTDLVEDKLFILTDDSFFTIFNYFNGQIINQYRIEWKSSIQEALFFYNFILITYQSKKYFYLALFNLNTGKIEKEEKMIRPHRLILEKLNRNKFATNSSERGQLLPIIGFGI